MAYRLKRRKGIIGRYHYQTGKRDSISDDRMRKAMPPSKRVSRGLSANQYGTKKQNKGRKYSETRRNRSDKYWGKDRKI